MKQIDLTKLPAKRQPRRTDMQLTHDRAILANIKLKNPGATRAELADPFYQRTEKRLAPRTIGDDLEKNQSTLASRNQQRLWSTSGHRTGKARCLRARGMERMGSE